MENYSNLQRAEVMLSFAPLLFVGRSLRKSCGFCMAFFFWCVQQSWTTLAGASPVTVIASELCS